MENPDQTPNKNLIERIGPLLRIGRLPVLMLACSLVLAILLDVLYLAWLDKMPWSIQAAVLVLVVLVLAIVILIEERLRSIVQEHQVMQQKAQEAEGLIQAAYQRLEAIFRINQKLVEASEEKDVIELVLRLAVELVGAKGASFVPLDEHGQPLVATTYGDLPLPKINDWLEYLASPVIRDRCGTCASHGTLATTCPLISGPFSDAFGLFCLPVRRGEREFGVLNLFMPQVHRLDHQLQNFLQAMMDETALALEGVRLRERELSALRQLQAVREKADLNSSLLSMLENAHRSLEGDFALLHVPRLGSWNTQINHHIGGYPESAQHFVQAVMQGVIASGKPVLLGNVAGDPTAAAGVRSLLAAPLLTGDQAAFGVLLVGNTRSQAFSQRQLVLLQTLAGQVALGVQNANIIAELQYRTMIEERTRLAREIHDGLAQTLGFLKLQIAQAQGYLARQETARLQSSLDLTYATLSEAYQDVRQAIDGLRLGPTDLSIAAWLGQIARDFEDLSGIDVVVEEISVAEELPSEIHAQLIRVVQEALSNVRKHAQTDVVTIRCYEKKGDLWLEISDGGIGFSPEDVSLSSQHGLRGMRERAELIGADFQVISRPQNGTAVMLRLPLRSLGLGEAVNE